MTKNEDAAQVHWEWYFVGCQAICLLFFFHTMIVIMCDKYGKNEYYSGH